MDPFDRLKKSAGIFKSSQKAARRNGGASRN